MGRGGRLAMMRTCLLCSFEGILEVVNRVLVRDVQKTIVKVGKLR